MNPLFADWLRETSVDLAGVDLAARIAAADALAESAAGTDVLRLVALAFGQPHDDAAGWLRDPFKQAEPSFPLRGNDAELRVLAAAILEQVCRSGELRLFAAQAVAVACHRGWDCPLAEVAEAAAEALTALAESARRPAGRPVASIPKVWTEKLEEAVAAVIANPQYAPSPAVGDALKELARAAQAAAAAAARCAERVADWSDRNARLAKEETGLLWWLLSGRSETLGEPWHVLPPAVLAVAAGRELAAAAAVLPAPPQATALLAQLIEVNARPKKLCRVACPASPTTGTAVPASHSEPRSPPVAAPTSSTAPQTAPPATSSQTLCSGSTPNRRSGPRTHSTNCSASYAAEPV